MLTLLMRFLRENGWALAGFAAGVLLTIFAPFAEQWLGARSVGILMGGGSAFAILMTFIVIGNVLPRGLPDGLAVVVLLAPLLLAGLMRHKDTGNVREPLPAILLPTFTTEQVMLAAALSIMLVLLIALGRALARGESISLESHWGGLGGGLGGWRISTPFVYLGGLLSIAVMLAAVAWQVSVKPAAERAHAKATASAKEESTGSTKEAGNTSLKPAHEAMKTAEH